MPDRIDYVARLAAAWVRLGRTARNDRRLALVLSDYPARGGRTGYAVGLDTAASAAEILQLLRAEGFRHRWARLAGSRHRAPAAGKCRSDRDPDAGLSRLAERHCRPDLQRALAETWGAPAGDAFRLPVLRCGNVLVLLQPDRGALGDRKSGYHDLNCPPSHAYVALYAWLRETEKIDALVHLGTHGTLEWLPGKALALSAECWPEAVLGALPVIYPFIVNNPGEAVQAKRRLAAVTIGHLTPPLSAAGLHGPLAELEGIIEEYAAADGLDRRRLQLPRGRDRRTRLEQRARRRLRAAQGRAQPAGHRQARRPALRHQGAQHPRRPAHLRPHARRGDGAGARVGDGKRGGHPGLRRSRACGAGRRPRRTPRGARSRRRAVARPRRRAADGAQPHLDRSARHPDPHRVGHRRARGQRSRAPLPAGSRRAAARAGHRPLGLGLAAHRRRRSRAGAVAISACSRPGTRPRAGSPASKSCRWPRSTGRAST